MKSQLSGLRAYQNPWGATGVRAIAAIHGEHRVDFTARTAPTPNAPSAKISPRIRRASASKVRCPVRSILASARSIVPTAAPPSASSCARNRRRVGGVVPMGPRRGQCSARSRVVLKSTGGPQRCRRPSKMLGDRRKIIARNAELAHRLPLLAGPPTADSEERKRAADDSWRSCGRPVFHVD